MKFHLIQPMGGGGTRFLTSEIMPKPLININNKPFFYWSTKSLSDNEFVKDITYVVLQEHIEKYSIDKEILKYFPNANIVSLQHILNGAVLTCIEGVKSINDDLPIVFNDCDHAFKCTDFFNFLENFDTDVYGGLLTFESDENKYSYIKYDQQNNIVGTVEKEVVSNDAICGAYYFKNIKVFMEYANKYIKNCSYKEFFMSGVYNEICNDKHKIIKFKTDFHLSFGTPNEYNNIKNSEKFKVIENGDNRKIY